MTTIDLSDGVDYVYWQHTSEKGAPMGEYEPSNGCIRMCLDEIFDGCSDVYVNQEQTVIDRIIEIYNHELIHKWICWGLGEDSETFNEMDERIMMIIRDWIEYELKHEVLWYDRHPI